MQNSIITLLQKIGKVTNTSTQFKNTLSKYYEEMYRLDAQNSKIFDLPDTELQAILQLSFENRINIRNKWAAFLINDEKEDKKLLAAVSNINRALRYLEDYVLEILLGKNQSTTQEYITLKGEGPYFLITPSLTMNSPDDLQSGDVILTRGKAFTSAAIARIGVSDSQFSHLSFLYRNPNEGGKLYTIEAHIEIGSVLKPFDVHIDQKNARTVVFRFEDGKMAHKAAEYMFLKVKKQSATGKNIDYDFSMQYRDSSKLFCSEVIYDGFYQASNGTLDIPRFKTKFNAGLIEFLNRLGVQATEENIHQLKTFCPADIEYDSRFALVAEWKNPKLLKNSRVKDAVLTKMFQWMEKDNYQIIPPFSINILSRLTWVLRRTPLIKKLVIEKLPLNMNIEQLELFLSLDKIGIVLENTIIKKQKTHKQPLSMKEMFDTLDDYKDKMEHKSGSVFHKWFNSVKTD